jgi:hypothetical protein
MGGWLVGCAYVTRQHCGSGVAGGASKDSHFCWHNIAGRCYARQHKCILAASKNRFWPSVVLHELN